MNAIRHAALRLREHGRILREYAIDAWRYSRFAMPPESSMTRRWTSAHIAAQLTKDYHRVEKGLALSSPKRPFGDAVAARIRTGIASGTVDMALEAHASTALDALEAWNGAGKVADEVAPPLPAIQRKRTLDDLFSGRRSVRDFSDAPLDEAALARAVSKAIHTPSVCNRQPWAVTVLLGERKRSALALQNGNRGFGEIPAVAVVSVDFRNFGGASERNQGWIDGGLFAMSVVWAAESEGLATCMLNWSVANERSDRLRELVGLKPWDQVICLIALGHPRTGARVARSPRRDLDDVLRVDRS